MQGTLSLLSLHPGAEEPDVPISPFGGGAFAPSHCEGPPGAPCLGVQEPSWAPLDSHPEDRGTQPCWETEGGHGAGLAWPRPGRAAAPLPPPWVSGQRSLGPSGCLFPVVSAATRSLKITRVWAWAPATPLKEADRCSARPGFEVGTAGRGWQPGSGRPGGQRDPAVRRGLRLEAAAEPGKRQGWEGPAAWRVLRAGG